MKIHGVPLLSYQEVLETIEGDDNHLLLGNGFNRGLGIDTGYKSIFQKMIEKNHGIYQDVAQLVDDCEYDLEKFIGVLLQDVAADNVFLRKYINNKIKADFMQATHEIVKAELKNIYADNNERVFILLKHFSNYFTLNYDSFLYLLLLNYKSVEKEVEKGISIQATLKFKEDNLNTEHDDIVDEIRKIRNGSLTISVTEDLNPTSAPLNKVTKVVFSSIIKQYSTSNHKGWKGKEIDQAINLILEEEKKNQVLPKVDDGAQFRLYNGETEFVFDLDSNTQNLFFLHGAFHIYKDGKSIKKITQQSDKALYDRLESILNNEEQEIICVFQSENKLEAINENEYLKKCYNTLGELSGNVVILGSALSDNDDHIFDQISKSKIENVFISTTNFTESIVEGAISKFPDKRISFFDAKTISYKKAEEHQD